MFHEEHAIDMVTIGATGSFLWAGGLAFNQNELGIVGAGIMGLTYGTLMVTGSSYWMCGSETVDQYWQYIDSEKRLID